MKILVVDDSRSSAAIITQLLSQVEACGVETCLHPVAALEACEASQFDLVLVDYMMPGMNGTEFITALRTRENYAFVPLVMITSEIDQKIRHAAFAAGATDFLNKPFDATEMQARVRNLLALRRAQTELADQARLLTSEVQAATRHLAEREEEVIWRLAKAVEYHDGTTGEHISRVATISQFIALGVGLDEEAARIVYLAAPLHDIGKIAIPDAILQKPGRLTDDEMEIMRQHVAYGSHILSGGSSDLIRIAEMIVASHHERWDGTGYPAGLAGQDIPIQGRIVAVADVFDALCSARPYKRAWSLEEAYAEIVAQSGRHFDPACVEAFKERWDDIRAVMSAQQTPALP